MKVPFCPLPLNKAKKASRIFSGPARALSKAGQLKLSLEESGIPLSPSEYMSITLFTCTFLFILTSALLFFISSLRLELIRALGLSLLIGLVAFFAGFIYLRTYPKILIKRRVREVEQNLLPALKQIMIQIKSGAPMYDSLVSVAKGSFGKLSEEFTKLVKDVDTGVSLESALDKLSTKNPSLYFRRAIWQISNGMKAGSDIGGVLSELVHNLSQQKIVAIRKYGAQLNPLTLVYMMLAIIMPALGITFLFVFSSFAPLPVSEYTFYAVLIGLAVFQFFYMGIIKSRRPTI